MPSVVVVEDNELNLKLFHDLLTILKCKVIATKTGSNALGITRSSKPDLVLMDIQLDGMSGIDLIKQIKSSPDLKDIPIIAVSAFAMKHEEMKIRQSGCDLYLAKPVAIEDFFNAVKKFIYKN